jgi:hypothetical protein
MSFGPMLRHFPASSVLIAIRAAVNEPPAPRYTTLPHDPWFGSDPTFASAWAGAPGVVAW